MTEAFGPLRGLAIVIPNEVRNLREAIILENIGHKEKIAPRRFLAEPALSAAERADSARNDKTARSAKHGASLPCALKNSQTLGMTESVYDEEKRSGREVGTARLAEHFFDLVDEALGERVGNVFAGDLRELL